MNIQNSLVRDHNLWLCDAIEAQLKFAEEVGGAPQGDDIRADRWGVEIAHLTDVGSFFLTIWLTTAIWIEQRM